MLWMLPQAFKALYFVFVVSSNGALQDCFLEQFHYYQHNEMHIPEATRENNIVRAKNRCVAKYNIDEAKVWNEYH